MTEPAPPESRDASNAGARRRTQTGPVLSKQPSSGAKGFAVIFGAMVGIIGLLWLLAWLVSPS